MSEKAPTRRPRGERGSGGDWSKQEGRRDGGVFGGLIGAGLLVTRGSA